MAYTEKMNHSKKMIRIPTSNGHVSEEQPARDERLFGRAGWLAHDVKIWGVEAQSGSGQTVSYQVHPQQLNWDQSLGQTKSSSQENTAREECHGRENIISN